jgi:hypothetical protein
MQTTQRGIEAMCQAIDELDFSRIKAKLMHRQDGVIALRQIESTEAGYRQFLKLAAKYPDAPIVPSKEVDEFWHMHILDTQRYGADCERIFGYMIHHDPYSGIDGEADEARHLALAAASNELSAREFAEGEGVAYCIKAAAKNDATAYCIKAAAQGDATAYCIKAAAHGDATAYCIKAAAQGDATAYCIKAAAHGDAAAYCIKSAVNRDGGAYCIKSAAKSGAAAYCIKSARTTDATAYCIKAAARAAATTATQQRHAG